MYHIKWPIIICVMNQAAHEAYSLNEGDADDVGAQSTMK